MLDVPALEHAAAVAEFELDAGRARRGHGRHFVAGKLPLGEHAHHLAPDVPSGADDDYPITHVLHSKPGKARPLAG